MKGQNLKEISYNEILSKKTFEKQKTVLIGISNMSFKFKDGTEKNFRIGDVI